MADGRVSFSVEAVVRGYHAYKHIWAAVYGEELPCEREAGNRVDAFAVAVMKDGTVVGHVPKKISSVCSLYLRRGGSIICRVGSRRYSEDLIQGGLEIPCVLIFEGGAMLTTKAKKLVVSALLGVASGVSPKGSTILKFSRFLFSRFGRGSRKSRKFGPRDNFPLYGTS